MLRPDDAIETEAAMTTQIQQIRRRTNDTVDIDYYRNRALMLRREAMKSTARSVDFSTLGLVAAAALIVALIVMPWPYPAPKGTAAKAAPAAIAVALKTF
jgi:hypothetical protein